MEVHFHSQHFQVVAKRKGETEREREKKVPLEHIQDKNVYFPIFHFLTMHKRTQMSIIESIYSQRVVHSYVSSLY